MIPDLIPRKGGLCPWCRIKWWFRTILIVGREALPSKRRPDPIVKDHRPGNLGGARILLKQGAQHP